MPTPGEQIAALLHAARQLPYGPTRLDLLDEAVRIADLHQDTAAAYALRRELMDTARQSSRIDVYAATFAWCQAASERDPTRFPPADLIEDYQNLLGKVVNFPDITREQYERLFADMLRVSRQHGHPLWLAYVERRAAAADFGDPDMAREADRELRKHRRQGDWEFEVVRSIWHHAFLGDDAAAAALADGYFIRQHRNRAYYDPWVAGHALLPLWRVGRRRDAAAMHEQMYRIVVKVGGYWWYWGEHLTYLALVGNLDRGVRLFEHQFPVALGQADPLSRFHCYRHAVVLFDRLAEADQATVRFKAPPSLPWTSPDRVQDVATVRAWLAHQAETLATQFDSRNGNSYWSDNLRATRQ